MVSTCFNYLLTLLGWWSQLTILFFCSDGLFHHRPVYLYSSNLYHFGDHPRIVEIRPKIGGCCWWRFALNFHQWSSNPQFSCRCLGLGDDRFNRHLWQWALIKNMLPVLPGNRMIHHSPSWGILFSDKHHFPNGHSLDNSHGLIDPPCFESCHPGLEKGAQAPFDSPGLRSRRETIGRFWAHFDPPKCGLHWFHHQK